MGWGSELLFQAFLFSCYIILVRAVCDQFFYFYSIKVVPRGATQCQVSIVYYINTRPIIKHQLAYIRNKITNLDLAGTLCTWMHLGIWVVPSNSIGLFTCLKCGVTAMRPTEALTFYYKNNITWFRNAAALHKYFFLLSIYVLNSLIGLSPSQHIKSFTEAPSLHAQTEIVQFRPKKWSGKHLLLDLGMGLGGKLVFLLAPFIKILCQSWWKWFLTTSSDMHVHLCRF